MQRAAIAAAIIVTFIKILLPDYVYDCLCCDAAGQEKDSIDELSSYFATKTSHHKGGVVVNLLNGLQCGIAAKPR
jgi:hypothetical protein